MKYIITERDVGLASLFFQVINAINRCEQHNIEPIVYFKEQCVYYAGVVNDRDNVWEYYFEPVITGLSSNSIPGIIKAEIADIYTTRDVKKLNNTVKTNLSDGYMMSCHYGNHRKMQSSLIVPPHLVPEVYEDGHRERSFDIIDRYFKPRDIIKDKILQFKDSLGDVPVLGVHVRGTDALVNRAEKWRKNFHIKNYIDCINIFLEKYPTGKALVASDDSKLFDMLKNEFTDDIVSYNSNRQSTDDLGISGESTRGNAMMPTYLCNDRLAAAQNGEDAVVEMYLLSQCKYLVHNASGFAHFSLLLNPELDHIDSQRPGGFETTLKFKSMVNDNSQV